MHGTECIKDVKIVLYSYTIKKWIIWQVSLFFLVKAAIYLHVSTKHFSFHTLNTAEAVVRSCFQNSLVTELLQLYFKKTPSEMYSLNFCIF